MFVFVSPPLFFCHEPLNELGVLRRDLLLQHGRSIRTGLFVHQVSDELAVFPDAFSTGTICFSRSAESLLPVLDAQIMIPAVSFVRQALEQGCRDTIVLWRFGWRLHCVVDIHELLR